MDDKSKKQEIVVRIICVILSFGLWLYVSNVENTTREYKFDKVPVEILNTDILKTDYKLALVPNQNFTVTLNLEGPQNDVYRVTRDQFKIVANLKNYVLKKGLNEIPVEIVNSPSNININKKNTGVLKVKILLDEYAEKKMPIKSDIKPITQQGIYAGIPDVTPATATVSGPKEYVNKVKVLSVSGEVQNVNKNMDITLPIVAVDENNKPLQEVKVEPEVAAVSIKVNKGKSVPINVVTTGKAKEGITINSIVSVPDKVELIGDDSILDNISKIDTEPLDISKITEGGEVSIGVSIPKNVKINLQGNKVKVKIALVSTITKQFEVPVTLQGLDTTLDCKLDVQKVTVSLRGEESVINSIKNEDIKAELNLQGKKEGDYVIAPNITSEKLNNVKLTGTVPDKVKVNIVKKQ
ncbi:YbbR domain-containing protein [Clostridium cavendishii DSM 21758]|uniref:YbbR domain-containing protein n=1 Tax=Clostridium cavendishii DSM 21758 TaxID=1121302 RepID=A0A1M6LYT4_9CLOT|nr:CdaR family protein [Clostridium cavendishii]SHJ76213.1 YbbR domain-containing protein [Clostridium cavendishii DSM 21758]